MKVTANIATYPPRYESLKKSLATIIDQVDEVRICLNEHESSPEFLRDMDKVTCIFPDKNLTDNGKLFMLDYLDEGTEEIYFSCDDDILYPLNYVDVTLNNIKKYQCIISYHGRTLESLSSDYYRDHKAYRMFGDVYEDTILDVCSTGVTAFKLSYFHPRGLAHHELLKMSDLTFALEAKKQSKMIACCRHKIGWLNPIMNDENIFDSLEPYTDQNALANEIFRLK